MDHNTEQIEPIACAFCPATVETIGDAIEADWIPSYYDGDDECPTPVCPTCQGQHLRVDDDGEFVVTPTTNEAF